MDRKNSRCKCSVVGDDAVIDGDVKNGTVKVLVVTRARKWRTYRPT